ncbi:hypothetical protein F5Y10DRAFT_249381 [Nemania abortiva]|nr:hypothetical protein F5Y10DRAFT_249381 [Nemania abortiva]
MSCTGTLVLAFLPPVGPQIVEYILPKSPLYIVSPRAVVGSTAEKRPRVQLQQPLMMQPTYGRSHLEDPAA